MSEIRTCPVFRHIKIGVWNSPDFRNFKLSRIRFSVIYCITLLFIILIGKLNHSNDKCFGTISWHLVDKNSKVRQLRVTNQNPHLIQIWTAGFGQRLKFDWDSNDEIRFQFAISIGPFSIKMGSFSKNYLVKRPVVPLVEPCKHVSFVSHKAYSYQ